MASIVLQNVTKVFPGPVTAVEKLNLVVSDHEFVVLVGPSGCGKTTTLRMIAGLEEVSSGQIRIGDRMVNQVSPKNRNLAMVFQDYALYPHMSVSQNMAFGLHLRYGGGVLARTLRRLIRPAKAAKLAELRNGIKQQVQHVAGMLGIQHLLNRMPRHLSGGERQRVALGRAIVRNPAAFLFDEPLSNLDAKLRAEMRRELKQLHRKLQTTTLYVTHDQAEALALGQRIVVMEKGKIQQVGSPAEIYDQPKNRFVAEFIGTPPMNFATGRFRQSERSWEFVGHGLKIRLNNNWKGPENDQLDRFADRDVTLGIRPADIQVALAESAEENGRQNCGRVLDVEPLGDITLVHVGLGMDDNTTFVSKVSGRARFGSGDVVNLQFDAERVHLFDPQTGDSVLYA